ncbi:MAG: hypothetical protein COU98_01925 [Candidatus Staskawiczbacteria bacterium CG10_big_fil_rev_8_21_14_0_10_38_10]|uniref:Uncharacterized protein n=1 Tax=Candidatus Staskawiczbacteria bacterium CG10_big_fil_rev_8_21_14_0_10_38_10 TaxID=1974891 RepID=A0A2H9T154_9BACT|nr:MAG: hypothetical protein COU98_01925 [Candidatus Staskawiczbacteria bacterium CG10_big_fil_rev_8_21_14_0_10_38_10]
MSENNQNKSQKEIEIIFRPWKVFATEAVLFFLTLVLGIITASKLSQFLKVQEVPLPSLSLKDFLVFFLVATFSLYLLASLKKFQKGKEAIYKILFILAIFWGGGVVLSLWIGDFLAILIILILVFFWLKSPLVLIHDLVIILGLAGAGSILGIGFDPRMIIILLVIFSIYDFIAVCKTKHMVKMAREMIEKKVVFGLIVPVNISDFLQNLKKVKFGGRFLILGGGDVVFPLLLSVSIIQGGVLKSLIVAIFSLIGLFATYKLFIGQKVRQPIPALPLIALFSVIGYLITRLI